MADADVPVNRPARAASTQASTEAAAALQSVGAEATRDAAGSIAAKEAAAAAAGSPSNRASVTNGNGAAAADGARGSVAGRATSPSNAGGDKTGAAAAAAADAGAAPAAEEQKRGSTITAANGGGADATRAATVTDRPASGSVSSGGDVKQAERAPTQQPLAAVAEEPAPARASVSKASPVPPAADQPGAAAPAASNGANGNGADLSKAVTPNNGGGTAQTNAALKDRAERKDQLAGGDKDITKPRPIEDVKRELEQGSRRCTDAWNGKADAFSGLKADDGTVRYMGFVLLDGDQKAALFHVDGGKTGPAAATAKADDKAFRLLKLSDLVDSKEEVKLMYTSSPIVLASAAGKGEVVKQLVDRFGVDPQHPQTIYTAAFDKEQKKWVVDNSQGRRVSAGEVALANGFEDVAATGGCRMCAGGDCTLM